MLARFGNFAFYVLLLLAVLMVGIAGINMSNATDHFPAALLSVGAAICYGIGWGFRYILTANKKLI